MANEKAKDTRSATQRIEDLERGLMGIYQTADNMARDMQTIKEAIKLLGNKLDAVVKSVARSAGDLNLINDDVISKIMIENNIEELKGKVQKLVSDGVLIAATEVTGTSFIVGRELNDAGEVQNPRMQFVVSALAPEVKAKFPGAKVGDVLELQEGKWKFEVQETYDIVIPKPVEQVALEQKIEDQVSAPVTSFETPAAPSTDTTTQS